ncbi:zinc ribbon domain-containing protein [Aestuariimicrobium soli]|uniref:zinc ribbon domain-containing protein n=1 Tax=Aestuariimicrobium soli TaxID=2035834 RepID=UPI003EBE9E7E
MLAEPADQLRLLDLAAIDAQISQNEHRRTHLPELAQLQELSTERRSVDEELVAAEVRLSDAQADQERVEGDLAPARDRLARNQQRIDSGAVSDPKALRGMVEETEHLKGRISKLEDDELEVMQVIEDLTGERDAIIAKRDQVNDRARVVIGKRNAALAEVDQRAQELATERGQQLTTLPQTLLGEYDTLRAKLGSGAAALEKGQCSGCRLQVNESDLRSFRQAPANQVLHCEECGRILVRTPDSFS